MSDRIFLSFAESDGGHSYLAARAMINPRSVGHLVFRTSVAESLEAVAAGQANYAVVPAYNSITQWEGATMKALATGAFEIFASVCMPTSYVLVAHKEYMAEFVSAYSFIKNPDLALTPEEAAKIYTRFLSKIYVGAQAEEQYRGRLIRPDMTKATIELSRNPLRILEELTRTELLKAITSSPRYVGGGGGQGGGGLPPHVSGGSVPYGQPITVTAPPPIAPMPTLDIIQAPAALVASGLLDAPGDPEGWDQPGSLGEIVSLLRKLLVLLNVYSFGSPDLPENKTQYFLLGKRGSSPPPDAITPRSAAPTRIMVMVRPPHKTRGADLWLKPRRHLAKKAAEYEFAFDRPPIMVSPSRYPVLLFEGGRVKEGFLPQPRSAWQRTQEWFWDRASPKDKGKKKDKPVTKPKTKPLRKALEKRPDGMKDDSPNKFDTIFLGEYPTWCDRTLSHTDSCWCCDEAHGDSGADDISNVWTWLLLGLVALVMLALTLAPAYCQYTGYCSGWGDDAPETAFVPEAPPPAVSGPVYPGVKDLPPPVVTGPAIAPPPVAPPPLALPKIPVFHVAFFEMKANLTVEALNAIGTAASQNLQADKSVMVRIVALGPREDDEELWQRRLYAVKDELVRQGVPASRIRYEGDGPYAITIRGDGAPPKAYDTDQVDDPMTGDDE